MQYVDYVNMVKQLVSGDMSVFNPLLDELYAMQLTHKAHKLEEWMGDLVTSCKPEVATYMEDEKMTETVTAEAIENLEKMLDTYQPGTLITIPDGVEYTQNLMESDYNYAYDKFIERVASLFWIELYGMNQGLQWVDDLITKDVKAKTAELYKFSS